MKTLCRFMLPEGTTHEFIEAQMALAVLSAESIHGKSKVRLAGGYYIPAGRPQCLIDVSSDVGEHIAQVFTGLMIRHLGEDEFQVERITGDREDEVNKLWP